MTTHRRDFLRYSAALSIAALLPQRVIAQPRFETNPFTLGVASGLPQPEQVVLWTRLAPDPLNGGGMPNAAVNVGWEIASDEQFRNIVDRGEVLATPQSAHAVHVTARRLLPFRWYWYRFMAGDAISTIGRTRTAPAANDMVSTLQLALASCQHYEHGYFSAYRDMLQHPIDCFIHVGDYIYESSWGRNGVRSHHSKEPYTLNDYRNRYAQYRLDPQLQAAHAACPWLVIWDDHEVDNDYANDRSQDLDPPATFLRRRAAAYQAYYEHMPLAPQQYQGGPNLKIYGAHQFGQLAQIQLLDMRQYRDYHVCSRPGRGGGNQVDINDCPERLQPGRSLLGATQEQWLTQSLSQSSARWNVIAQTTLVAQSNRATTQGRAIYTDGWDGYPLAREKLLNTITQTQIRNPIVIGGDVHMAVASDLKIDFENPRSAVIASEFVTSSITAYGPSQRRTEALVANNPHIHFANGTQRGYTQFTITPKQWETRYRAVTNPRDPQSEAYELARYTVVDGRAGPQRG
jgi:alkaline phosphatase D